LRTVTVTTNKQVCTKSFLTVIVVLFQLPGDGCIGLNGFSGLQLSAMEFTHAGAGGRAKLMDENY